MRKSYIKDNLRRGAALLFAFALYFSAAGSGTACPTAKRPLDFDGDGKTDLTVVRNTGGGAAGALSWYIKNSGGTTFTTTRQWGIVSDWYVPADYDGDGKSDIAVWRGGAQGYFYILESQNSTLRADAFGQTGDDPTVVGDYTGDGKVDPAVYRSGANAGQPSFWFYRASSGPFAGQVVYNQWGQNGDFPAPGDFDGDGRNDFAVQRGVDNSTAQFYLNQTTAGQTSFIFGTPTYRVAPGYYDNDCKTDIAVIRGVAGEFRWYIRNSTNGAQVDYTFGLSGTDYPTPGDYDGDGLIDISVWRPSSNPSLTAFYWRKSSDGLVIGNQWGQSSDYPPASGFVH